VDGDPRGCERGRHGLLHDGCSTGWRGLGKGGACLDGQRTNRQGNAGGKRAWPSTRTWRAGKMGSPTYRRQIEGKNGLAVCGARQGRVGRFLTPFRTPKTVEPEERFPERPGCPSSMRCCFLSLSLRAMCRILLERGRRGREAPKGPRDTRFEQVSEPVNFWRCSCLGGYSLRTWLSAWRACTAGEARESLRARLDAIGDRGRRFLVQHNIEYQVYIARAI
jgi:hypothetical protein